MAQQPRVYPELDKGSGYEGPPIAQPQPVGQPPNYYNQPQPMVQGQPVVQAQPMHQPITNVVMTTQPQQMVIVGPRPWNAEICGCFEDMGTCCAVMWCEPCFVCWLSEKMGEGCCAGWCVPYAPAALRMKFRTQQNIEGSMCMDCIMTNCMCTAPCTLCQLNREVNLVRRQGMPVAATTATTTVITTQ